MRRYLPWLFLLIGTMAINVYLYAQPNQNMQVDYSVLPGTESQAVKIYLSPVDSPFLASLN